MKMRHIPMFLGVLTALVSGPTFAASGNFDLAALLEAAGVRVAETTGCATDCEERKQACLIPYTRTNSSGVTYVTVEGTKYCNERYRACVKKC